MALALGGAGTAPEARRLEWIETATQAETAIGVTGIETETVLRHLIECFPLEM